MIPREIVQRRLSSARTMKKKALQKDNDLAYSYACNYVKILEDILDSDEDIEKRNRLRYIHPKTEKARLKRIQRKNG